MTVAETGSGSNSIGAPIRRVEDECFLTGRCYAGDLHPIQPSRMSFVCPIRFRVRALDVGGSFGLKGQIYPEMLLSMIAEVELDAETGAAPVAIINAILNALPKWGSTELPVPARPEQIWRAIRDARQRT